MPPDPHDAACGRLLVINQHYPPDTLASGQILAELSEDLVTRHGWQVRVIAGPPLKLADKVHWKPVRQETLQGVEIRRVSSYNPEQRTLLRRLRHYLSYSVRALLAGFFEPRPDVIMVMSTPPLLTGLIGWILKRRFGAKLIYDVQDLFPDILEKRLRGGFGYLLFRLLGILARFLEQRCDSIVVIGRKMEDIISQRAARATLVTRIPNWSDATAIVPLGKNSDFARQHQLVDRFVIGLSGNLGLNQGIESILEAVSQSHGEPWFWLFVGDGENRSTIEQYLTKHQLANAARLPYQPKDKLAQSLGAIDVGLVTVRAGVSPYLIPSKLYGLMAAGTCILAAVDDDSEVAAFVTEEKIGLVVAPEDPLGLLRAVRYCFDHQDECSAMGSRGREVLLADYDRRQCTDLYHHFLTKVRQA